MSLGLFGEKRLRASQLAIDITARAIARAVPLSDGCSFPHTNIYSHGDPVFLANASLTLMSIAPNGLALVADYFSPNTLASCATRSRNAGAIEMECKKRTARKRQYAFVL